MMYAAIRLRGNINVRYDIKHTLNLLNLRRVNHAVLVPQDMLPMLRKVKDYVTWGEVSEEGLDLLINRLHVPKSHTLESYIKSLNFPSKKAFKEALMNQKIKKIYFRLHPPRKGLKSIKRPYPYGDLGYRKDAINDLIKKMR